MFSFDQIKELMALVAERRLEALEIERGGFRLRIVGRSPAATVAATTPAVIEGPSGSGTQTVTEAQSGPAASPKATTTTADALEGHVLTSPIVGTFYVAPSPDADPFAKVGDRVKKGQVVCIVEAMKLMNEIESDVDGVVLQVLPENAEPVEYGQPLFEIDAD